MNKGFNDIAILILSNPKYKRMMKYIAHSNISCYEHCYNVAFASYKFVLKHKIKCNVEDLVTGALLHDYYLYDWHDKNNGITLHGFKHHKYSNINAIEDFDINKRVQKIICSHMFPVTIWTIPVTKEAIIVNFFDKWIALKEIFKVKISNNKDMFNESDINNKEIDEKV